MDRSLARFVAGWFLWVAGGVLAWVVLFSPWGLTLRSAPLQWLVLGIGAVALPVALVVAIRGVLAAERDGVWVTLGWLARVYVAVLLLAAVAGVIRASTDWLDFLSDPTGTTLVLGGIGLGVVLLAFVVAFRFQRGTLSR